MYNIIYGGFMQETNTFSPCVCTLDHFKINDTGEAIFEKYTDTVMLGGMIQTLRNAPDVNVIPATVMQAHSNGPVDRKVADLWLEKMFHVIDATQELHGLFLSLHGGMTLTDEGDGIGYLLERLRERVGAGVVIAASSDLHANITKRVISNLDILTGYLTYPHEDVFETSVRAANLGLQCLRGEINPVIAFVKLPLINQSEGCITSKGPLRKLMDDGIKLVEQNEILDFTLYHMQTWLDVEEAGASVVVIAHTKQQAAKHVEMLAQRFFDMRDQLVYALKSVDEVIDIALENTTGKPVILSDSADASSAGSGGDSTEVLRRLLERNTGLRATVVVADPDAPTEAEAIGVGKVAKLTFGGKVDRQRQRSITVEGKIEQVFDGDVLVKCGPYEGLVCHCGKTVLFKVQNIDILICEIPALNFFPDQFEGFGLHIPDYDLVVVKSALAFRELFKKYTDLSMMYTVDTPGASSGNLFKLDFKNVRRPIHPYDDMCDYKATNILFSKE